MAIIIAKKYLDRINPKKLDTIIGNVIQINIKEEFAVVNFGEEYVKVSFKEEPSIFKQIKNLGIELTFNADGVLDVSSLKTKAVKEKPAKAARTGCSHFNEPIC